MNFGCDSTLRSLVSVVQINLFQEDYAPGDSYHLIQTVTATNWQSVVIPRATSSDQLTDFFKYSNLLDYEHKKWINENAGFDIFFLFAEYVFYYELKKHLNNGLYSWIKAELWRK